MPRLAAAVLAHNEAADLAVLLATLSFADELVVADAGSSDDTAAVAAAAGARVIPVVNDLNFNVNKARAVDACTSEWVIYLDPDERVSPALAAAIRAAVADARAPYVAYDFPRRNNYFGRRLRFGGNYPDYQLRLFRRGRGRFPCRSVHERLTVDGPVGRLDAPLDHETYPTVGAYLRKLPLFVAAGADYLGRRGARTGWAADVWYLVLRPPARFLRRWLFKLGILDGWTGFLAAVLDAVQSALTYYEYRDRRGRAEP